MEYEKLSEKEIEWLEKRKKGQRVLMIFAIVIFVAVILLGTSYFFLDDPIKRVQTKDIVLLGIVAVSFVIGLYKDADRFLKIIDKIRK